MPQVLDRPKFALPALSLRLPALVGKYGWAGLLMMLLVLALWISALIETRQNSLRMTARQNVSAYALHAVVEFHNFRDTLNDTGPEARARIQLSFDILFSRVNGFKHGDFGKFVAMNPASVATIARLDAAMAKIDAALILKDQELNDHILPSIATLEDEFTAVASMIHSEAGDTIDHMYLQLENLRLVFNALICAIAGIGLFLFCKILRQNQRMRASKQDLLNLARRLEGAKLELENAHNETMRSHENLKRRNTMLQIHDIEMQTQNQRFDAALNNISQGLLMVDGMHRLIICNERFREAFGLTQAQTRPGYVLGSLMSTFEEIFTDTSEPTPESEPNGDLSRLLAHQHELSLSGNAISFIFETDCGKVFAISQKPMPDGGWVATYEDVTEQKRSEARITYLAHHDSLTDLPNRIQLRDRMDEELGKFRHHKHNVTLLYMDLDHFKAVNDSLGHSIGDMLLRQVGARLQSLLGSTHPVFRIGGDEFAALYFGSQSNANLKDIAESIIAAICEPFTIEGHPLQIGICVGISRLGSDGFEFNEVVSNADLALFEAKKSGRNAYRFFEMAMKHGLETRRQLEIDLENGIARGEFELYYQPIVDTMSLDVVCFEALMRWNHPERGMVSPASFIPVAEESGLIVPLGEWALRQACNDAAQWPNRIRVAVNLSSVQFKSGEISRTVFSALAASKLAPHLLELEITESLLLQDSDSTLETLHQLRSFGVHISMDDFGTGYSSLSYLRSFPFDKIKIDRSFVKELSEREDCRAIVRTITELGRSLNMVTTAEGVETKAQYDLIKQIGCTQIQGYFFGKPEPMTAFPALFERLNRFKLAA